MKVRAYYNDNDPQCCAWLRELMHNGLIMEGEIDSRSIADVQPADLRGFTRCHFFAGIGGWDLAFQFSGWPETNPSGPAASPASPTPQRGSGKPKTTRAISGRNSSDSSGHADPRTSSESKYREVLDSNGYLVRSKTCKGCGIEKPYSEFYVNSKGGRNRCKDCVKESRREYGRKHEQQESNLFHDWRRRRRGRALLAVARYRARVKGIPCTVTADAVQAAVDAGVCQLTGIPFNLDGGKTWDSPSLDRKDPKLGYTPRNTRVVLYAVNVMANIWGPEKILEIAKAIMERRRNLSESLQSRLTENLKRRLSSFSSLEYRETWKELATPSGVRLWAHTASGRRTSGSGCTGWPSPRRERDIRGRDGEAEPRAVARGRTREVNTAQKTATLAGWPTATVGDSSNTRNSTATRHRIPPTGIHAGDTLVDAVTLAGWTTPTSRDHKGDPDEPRAKGRASAVSGPWADALWHPCADGKWRRIPADVESGVQPVAPRLPEGMVSGGAACDAELFPLAEGVKGRVGLLRGAGNSIVPQVAAEFVKAFMEFRP